MLVCHCSPDAYAFRSARTSVIPSAAVEFVGEQKAAEAALPKADLLLTNRALDGDFDAEDGVELTRTLSSFGAPAAKLMLVSNFPEAQTAAQPAGALRGFGKRDMHSPQTKQRLRAALNLD